MDDFRAMTAGENYQLEAQHPFGLACWAFEIEHDRGVELQRRGHTEQGFFVIHKARYEFLERPWPQAYHQDIRALERRRAQVKKAP